MWVSPWKEYLEKICTDSYFDTFLLLSWLLSWRLALVLLFFFIHFMLEGVNLLSVIFWEETGNKWSTHTNMSGLNKQTFQAPSNRSTRKPQQTGEVTHADETGFVNWMVSKHGSPNKQHGGLRSWQHAHNVSTMRIQGFAPAEQESLLH